MNLDGPNHPRYHSHCFLRDRKVVAPTSFIPNPPPAFVPTHAALSSLSLPSKSISPATLHCEAGVPLEAPKHKQVNGRGGLKRPIRGAIL